MATIQKDKRNKGIMVSPTTNVNNPNKRTTMVSKLKNMKTFDVDRPNIGRLKTNNVLEDI